MSRLSWLRGLWRALSSLQLTIALLAVLMTLVVVCTLARVHLGTFGAVKVYIRSFFVWWSPAGAGWKIPVFPGGALVGLVLFFNLMAAQVGRLEVSWRKAGLWVVHFGLVLLFLGEFVTGAFQVETQLQIEEGQTKNWVEDPREMELAVIDESDPRWDQVYAIPAEVLLRRSTIAHPDWPFTLLVKKAMRNSALEDLDPRQAGIGSMATEGVGPGILAREQPPVSRDDEIDRLAAFVEVVSGDRSAGTWLLSNGISVEQGLRFQGKSYRLAVRPRRQYLHYSVTLKDFKHDVYPGTDIPKNFSSLVRLVHPERKEDRDVLIYMNHPLRYGGKAFYQASFGKNDTLSVLQVVENPGWLLPYLACILVSLGLVGHFLNRLRLGKGAA